jgi:hypothetical protein
MNDKLQERVDRLRRPFSGPMTVEEIDLLQDMHGFIEFGIRNGLSFAVVASALCHDLNEIARAGFDLPQGKAHGAAFKVAGYRTITDDDFGVGDELGV